MEYDKIKQLMEDMGNSKLMEVEIEFPDGTKISMKKEGIYSNKIISNIVSNDTDMSTSKNEVMVNVDANFNIIKSPMVGTFYLKPSPTSEPFVEVGNVIKKGQTVCIVEAMKLMNEIESEFDGEVVEVCANDGDAVEYGTPLFKLIKN